MAALITCCYLALKEAFTVLFYSATRLTVATQQTFTFDNLRVNTSTQQSMQQCSNYNRTNFAMRRDCQ